jgi:hypothetical protein
MVSSTMIKKSGHYILQEIDETVSRLYILRGELVMSESINEKTLTQFKRIYNAVKELLVEVRTNEY